MVMINLASYPSSSCYSLIRLTNSKTPITEFSVKPKTHFAKSSLSSACCSFSSSHRSLNLKHQFFFGKSGNPLGKRLDFRSLEISAFGFDNFENAQSVLESVAVITSIVVVHESGHFLAAYLQGIHVSKFAIGFGPVLAKFIANNVEYSVRAFPLGGFVGFPDNDPDSDIPLDDENLLKNRPVLDRVIVVSAGVVANIIFAYLLIFLQVTSVGLPVRESFPGVLVPKVEAFSAASRDGLLPGDIIVAIDGKELPKMGSNAISELLDLIKRNPKRNLLFKIERGKENLEIGITPDERSDGTGKIGVNLLPIEKFLKVLPRNLFEAFSFTGKEFWGLSSTILNGLQQTFLNFSESVGKVAGPVGIISAGAEVARSNIEGLYQFAAAVNINLAIVNLLPIPALDGGALALILVEAARGGRKLPLELEQRIMSSGIMLVFLLGLYITVRDTLNLDFLKDLL